LSRKTELHPPREKARDRGLAVRFVRHDALRLADLGEVFDARTLQPARCPSNFCADGVAGWLATVTRT
jgi:hypothetical protein